MKARAIAATLVGLLLAAPVAFAKDAPDWTGPYIGIQGGRNDATLNYTNGRSQGRYFEPLSDWYSFEPQREKKGASTYSVFAGYSYQLMPALVVGIDLFYEGNQRRDYKVQIYSYCGHYACPGPGRYRLEADTGSRVYGLEALIGFPVIDSRLMPYIKVGDGWMEFTGDGNGSDSAIRYGIGVQWRIIPAMGINLQYTRQKFGAAVDRLENRDLTIGLTWHF